MRADKHGIGELVRSLALLVLEVELVLCLGGARGRFFCSRWSGLALALLCAAAWYMPRIRSWLRLMGRRRWALPCCALAMAAGLGISLGDLSMIEGLSVLANALMLVGGIMWLALGAGSEEEAAVAPGAPAFLPLQFEQAHALPIILAAQMAGIGVVSRSVYLGVLVRGPSGPLILFACDAVFMLGLFAFGSMARSESRPSAPVLVGCLVVALAFAAAIALVPKTGAAAEDTGIYLPQNQLVAVITVRVCAAAFVLVHRRFVGGGLRPQLLLLASTFLAGTFFGADFSISYARLDNILGYLICGAVICSLLQYEQGQAGDGRPVGPNDAQVVECADPKELAAETKDLLTERELQVAELLAEDRTMAEIAQSLGLARSTVGSYSARIYEKLGVGSKGELIVRLRPPEPETAPEPSANPPVKKPRYLTAGLALDLLVACLCISSFAGGVFLAGWPPVEVGAPATGFVAVAAALFSLDGARVHTATPFAASLLLLGVALVLYGLVWLPSAAMFIASVFCCAFCLVDGSRVSARLGDRRRIGAVCVSVAVAVLLVFVGREAKTIALSALCFSRLVVLVAERLMDEEPGPAQLREISYSRMPRLVDAVGILTLGAGVYSCCGLLGGSALGVPVALLLALACFCPRAVSDEGDSEVVLCVTVQACVGIALGMSLFGGEMPVVYAVAWGPIPLRLALTVALLVAGACGAVGYLRSQRRRREFNLKLGEGRREELAELVGVTPGECEVLLLLTKGYTVNQAASKLCLSPAAVASRRSKAYKKLGIHRREDIAPVFEKLLEARSAQL